MRVGRKLRHGRPPLSASPPSALVVGLGNPGAAYEATRHNVGFRVVDVLAARSGKSWRASRRRALETEIDTRAGRVVLAKPQTFMNASGESVKALLKHHAVPVESLVVVHDELDLPVGLLRIKSGGGTAGHNGLQSIVRVCGSKDFVRLRFGIGKAPGRMPGADYVLDCFRPTERELVDVGLEQAADMLLAWLDEGLEAAQNRYHS